jgi:hypothetical protein
VPVIAGQVAERFGIEHLLWLPIAAVSAGLVLCLLLKEIRGMSIAPGGAIFGAMRNSVESRD